MARDNINELLCSALTDRGYISVPPAKFAHLTPLNGQAIFSQEVRYESNIYGYPSKFDFAIYHPQNQPRGLIVESICQQKRGTTEQKLPFLIMNIQQCFPYKTVLIIDGPGFRKGAIDWARSQAGNNLLAVYDMEQFKAWINSDRF